MLYITTTVIDIIQGQAPDKNKTKHSEYIVKQVFNYIQ